MKTGMYFFLMVCAICFVQCSSHKKSVEAETQSTTTLEEAKKQAAQDSVVKLNVSPQNRSSMDRSAERSAQQQPLRYVKPQNK